MLNEDVIREDEHAKLVDLVERLGEVRAAEALRLSRMTILRLVARRPVRLGTLAMLRIGMSKGV